MILFLLKLKVGTCNQCAVASYKQTEGWRGEDRQEREGK
jgi:hypothetical protein